MRRFPQALLAPLALGALLLAGCGDDSEDGGDAFVYPLAVGDTLVVEGQSAWTYYTPGLEHQLVGDSVYAFRTQWVVAEAGQFLGEPALRCDALSWWRDNEPVASSSYYAQRSGGLFLLGYDDAVGLFFDAAGGSVLPRAAAAGPLAGAVVPSVRAPEPGKGAATEERTVFENPRQVLAYPLEAGAQWIYQRQYDPWRIDKLVQSLTTEDPGDGLGPRRFAEIVWRFDLANDGAWDAQFDYLTVVDEFGLYRTDYRIDDLIVKDEDDVTIYVADVVEQSWREGAQPLEANR